MSTINPNEGGLSDAEIRTIFENQVGETRIAYLRKVTNAILAADRERRGAEPVAWQWRKRLDVAPANGGYLVWTEWEAVQPPYMEAHKLAKSDPENYQVRPLYLSPTAGGPREPIKEHPELDIMSFAYEAAYVSGAIHGFDTDAFDKLRRVVDAALARNSSGHSVAPSVQLSDESCAGVPLIKWKRLCIGYREAVDDIEGWAAYASDYFRNKWRLDETVAAHRALIDELDVPDSSDSVPLAANRMDRNQAGDPSAPQDSGG